MTLKDLKSIYPPSRQSSSGYEGRKLAELKDKEIHLIGVSGTEMSGLAFFLSSLGCKNLIGHDFKTKAEFKKSFFNYHEKIKPSELNKLFLKLNNGLKKINYKDKYLQGIEGADIIFSTSSWFRYQPNKPLFKILQNIYPPKIGERRGKKIIFWNWYNLLLEVYPGLWVGITGTAGKGTATNVSHHLLKTAGKKSQLISDSWQSLDFISLFKNASKTVLIAEVNNRTLTFAKYSKKSPKIAVITNIFPHHLDDHHNSFNEYKKVKLEIAKYQQPGDKIILNGDDAVLRQSSFKKRAIFYSLKDKDAKLINNDYLNSPHLKSDALAAAKVARLLKVSEAKIKRGFKTFKPRSGRMQTIRILRGVKYVDDAAATRIQSAILAVESFAKGKVILILEGMRKNPKDFSVEFKKLISVLKANKVKAVCISGKISHYLTPLLKQAGLNVFSMPDLTASVKQAKVLAKAGEVVLLSPACESFGEFKDYRERSAKFKKTVLSFSAPGGPASGGK